MKNCMGLIQSAAFVVLAFTSAAAMAAGSDVSGGTYSWSHRDGVVTVALTCQKQCEADRNQCKLDAKTPGNPSLKECIQAFNACRRDCKKTH